MCRSHYLFRYIKIFMGKQADAVQSSLTMFRCANFSSELDHLNIQVKYSIVLYDQPFDMLWVWLRSSLLQLKSRYLITITHSNHVKIRYRLVRTYHEVNINEKIVHQLFRWINWRHMMMKKLTQTKLAQCNFGLNTKTLWSRVAVFIFVNTWAMPYF